MRFLSNLLCLSLFILATGCTSSKDTFDFVLTPDATLDPYQPGFPIETKPDAITVASKLFEEKGGIQWIRSPQIVFAEKMTYKEAQERLGMSEAQYDHWIPETIVWLVIFEGRWQLIPFDPAPAAPTPLEYEGCVFSMFASGDGELISMGDSVCLIL